MNSFWNIRINFQLPLRVCTCMCSVVSDSATPWTVAHQALLSTGFPRQGYWSGLPFPSPGDLPDPGIEPKSPASPALQADVLLLSHEGRHGGFWRRKAKTQKW